jgi:hypothetical protein
MNVVPVNGFVHVSMEVKEESDSFVLLPDDYKAAENPYKVVTVLTDTEKFTKGSKLVVPTHVIRQIVTDEGDFYLIESSHVMAELR